MPPRLLLVDDEAHNRKLLRMVLRAGDYEFVEAENGREALDLMSRESVDLLLLDLMMPTPNGFDVIQEMKRSEALRDIPFIVASASSAPEDVERSLTLGAVDYFTKPLTEFDIRFQLPLKVRNALAVHQATTERLRAERMKAVSAMAVALNHEVNNPLQVIQGNVQLLLAHPGLPPECREKVSRVGAAGETIAVLTQRIAALRDIVTVDYPAGDRHTVPMVNFEASLEASRKDKDRPVRPGSRRAGTASREPGS